MTAPSRLRMTVLGSGSVGLSIAASFAQAGLSVSLLARGAAVRALREQGITVTGACGEHRIGPDRLSVRDVDEPDAQDIACDVLIVATKAYQVSEVLKRLMRQAGGAVAPKAVLLLQNGWGSADEARAALPADVPVFSSIMMIGIERRSSTHVHVNVQASPIRVGTLFGAAPQGMKDAVARGQAGFLPITYEDQVEPAILGKFLFNTCLNAIGAITRMTYGELVGNAHTRHLITQVADETIRVVLAERGLALAPDGAPYVEKTLTPFVMPKAAAHRSSMLQDVEAGRRTEVDYLNGAVVRMGQARGIATPANDAVASLVRARETQETAMTAPAFVATHARDSHFERGLRAFFEYRDLGIRAATQGRFAAHVIRAAARTEFASQPHLHRTEFQLVYVLKGWIEFEYEGQGRVRLEAGSCVHQPPGIRHRELGHSDDVEMLEIVMPADFATEEVGAVDG